VYLILLGFAIILGDAQLFGRFNLSTAVAYNLTLTKKQECSAAEDLAFVLISALASSANACPNPAVHISTLATIRRDTIVAVDASRSGGLVFPVLQSYERFLINVGKSGDQVTYLYVDILPKMTGSFGEKKNLRIVEACVLALAYFNDNQLMFETSGTYHNDGHVGNLLYRDGSQRTTYQVYWADFGQTPTSHLPDVFSTLPSLAMPGHFVMTTYNTLKHLIDATNKNPHFEELVRKHDHARATMDTEEEYFKFMTDAAQKAVNSALPEEDTSEFLNRLHPGLLFLYKKFQTRISTLEMREKVSKAAMDALKMESKTAMDALKMESKTAMDALKMESMESKTAMDALKMESMESKTAMDALKMESKTAMDALKMESKTAMDALKMEMMELRDSVKQFMSLKTVDAVL
jgi:hypothetical protein